MLHQAFLYLQRNADFRRTTLRSKSRAKMAKQLFSAGFLSIGLLNLDIAGLLPSPLRLSLDKTTVAVGEEVAITVGSTQDLAYCGVHLRFNGSKEEPYLFRVKHEGVDLPHTIRKKFSEPGEIEIMSEGRRVNSALGCTGKASAKLIVTGTAQIKLAQASANVGPELESRAAASDIEAMFTFGNLSAAKGDDARALKWFITAAQKGHPGAMNATGFMVEHGRGVAQDYVSAADWYHKAMKRGHADAMINRGLLIANGLGLPQSKRDEYVHYALSALYAKEDSVLFEAIKMREEIKPVIPATDLLNAEKEIGRFVREEIRIQ